MNTTIDSFEKAVEKLGENHPHVLQWRMFDQSNLATAMPDVEAYVKLRVVISAIKGDWKPTRNWRKDSSDEKEKLWMPVFEIYPKECATDEEAEEMRRGAYVLPTGEMADYVDALEVTNNGKANQFERFVFPDQCSASAFGCYFQRLLAQFLIG